MTNDQVNLYEKHAYHVLAELERLSKCNQANEERIRKLETNQAVLMFKCSLIGGGTALIISVIEVVLQLLLKV